MSTYIERVGRQWRDVVNAVLGLWIVASPWVLGFAGEQTAAWNAWIVGVIVAVAAVAALVQFHRWEEWVSAALGAWLIVSPWAFGVHAIQALVWNQIGVGLAIAVLAIWTALSDFEPEGEASHG